MRKLLETGRAEDGLPILPGECFLTATGRATTPYPKSKTSRAMNSWLVENACAEALFRKDRFNQVIFGAHRLNEIGFLPIATIESMMLYLFADEVIWGEPPLLKSMSTQNPINPIDKA